MDVVRLTPFGGHPDVPVFVMRAGEEGWPSWGETEELMLIQQDEQ